MEQDYNSRCNDDRISSLPDCLLHLIMSFLTAREAIQLSVLSKRWKSLWTTLPVLFFDFSDFLNREDNVVFHEYKINAIEKFRHFVNMYLLLRDKTSLFHTFRLYCQLLNNPFFEYVHPWIRYVIQHNIRVIEITIVADPTTSSLPPCLFTSQSLEDLSLTVFQYRHTPNTVNLPRLRRLHLGYIYISQNFMDMILCGCSMLEYLHLEFLNGLSGIIISSQNLKHLKIQNSCQKEKANIGLINAPALQCFHYDGCVRYLEGNMQWRIPSVDHACIGLCRCLKDEHVQTNALSGLSNAQFLKLKGSSIQGLLQNKLPKCLKFHNLKCLSVDSFCFGCYVDILPSFLEHLPNLEKLLLELTMCHFPVHNQYPKPIISLLKCKPLQQVESRFCSTYRNGKFNQLGKVLLDGTGHAKVQIIITPT